MHMKSLIFFVYPGPRGSEEPTTQSGGARRSQNQFTPHGEGVNKLIFKRFRIIDAWLMILIIYYWLNCSTRLYSGTTYRQKITTFDVVVYL